MRRSFFAALLVSAASGASALAEGLTVYGGVGSDEAFAVGVLFDRPTGRFFWGADLAQEGTQVDRTSGSGWTNRYPHSVDPSLSLNGVFGITTRLGKNKKHRLLLAAVVGVRSTEQECSSGQSYLGYRCYADQSPKTSYTFNGGGFLGVQFDRLFAGTRLTGESTTVLLGYNF